MLRMAFIVIIVGTFVGAMMPSGSRKSAATPDKPISVISTVSSPNLPDEPAAYGEVRLRRFDDNHFYADALVNGAPVHFLVDTGASGIALTRADAMRASIPLEPGDGDVVGQGAGGAIYGQMVKLDRVQLGNHTQENMIGVVIEGGDQSLLGQEFLSKFDSVEIHGEDMVLR